MGSWPGAAADQWWASLPPSRREALHRWMTGTKDEEPIPKHQLALDVVADRHEARR